MFWCCSSKPMWLDNLQVFQKNSRFMSVSSTKDNPKLFFLTTCTGSENWLLWLYLTAHIYLYEKVSATGSAWVQRLKFRGYVRERKGREEERGHLLWPRQGINKQTGCQAISTHSEQTGRLTNLPHIYGTEPGIMQVRKVRCWNNTRVVWMRLWSKSLQSYPNDNLLFSH